MDAYVISPGGVTLAVVYHFIKTELGTTLREIFHMEMPGLLKNYRLSLLTGLALLKRHLCLL